MMQSWFPKVWRAIAGLLRKSSGLFNRSCSLGCSAAGSLSQSEDLAQETFLIA